MAVQSIKRAFTLLRAIAQHPDGISVTDLARRTNLHKSTVSRLVMSLESEGAVERQAGTLHIGDGISDLVSTAMQPATLSSLAHPYLVNLSERLDETVGLCVPKGHCAYYIDQILTSHFIQVRDWTGERYPLHTVSSGKLFLAYGSPDAVDNYLNEQPLVPFTKRTIVDAASLRERLQAIPAQGFDWSFEEFTEGLAVVSAPIFGHTGQVVASVYACGPTFRFPGPDRQAAITEQIVATCKQLSLIISANRLGAVSESDADTPAR